MAQMLMQKKVEKSTGYAGSKALQKKRSSGAAVIQDNRPAQKRPNQTGMPDKLKAGVEALSGMSMDHVRVHYNSAKPAQLQAHAYAQGHQIHLAPGQEKHLPHEAWHVVQQAQGRVNSPMQMKQGIPVNDDQGLEHEADVMGAKAIQMVGEGNRGLSSNNTIRSKSAVMMQMRTGRGNHDVRTKRESESRKKQCGVPTIQCHSPQPKLRPIQFYYSQQGIAQSGLSFCHSNFASSNPSVAQLTVSSTIATALKSRSINGILICAEGVLTIAAAVVGGVMGGPAALFPAGLALLTGFIKLLRGVVTACTPDGQYSTLIDVLRAAEASLTIWGGCLGSDPVALLALFGGVAKLMRSGVQALKDHIHFGDDGGKVLAAIAAGLHAVEVAIGAISGGVQGLAADGVAGTAAAVKLGATTATAASKGARTAGQILKL